MQPLCRKLFWTIDGHASWRNRVAADRLSRLTPALAAPEHERRI